LSKNESNRTVFAISTSHHALRMMILQTSPMISELVRRPTRYAKAKQGRCTSAGRPIVLRA
jgi:hypothetical protein